MLIFEAMKIKQKGLVKVNSQFDPSIITFKDVIEKTGISRQGIDQAPLTFGIVVDLNTKVIIRDDKYEAFMDNRKKK